MSYLLFLFVSFLFKSWICTAKPSDALDSYHGEWAHLFTAEERAIIASKPIRREMRDLSDDEWQRIVDALWVMKLTSQEDGEALYGVKYSSYDQILCQHLAADTLQGDIAHHLPAFFTFHRAVEMRMEQSLQAIDPIIGTVPYWDFRLDATDPSGSIIFSDSYMGSVPGNADENFMVTDGKFAYWPISRNDNFESCSPVISKSPYGYLRAQWLVQNHPYVVRYGNTSCNESISYENAVDDWYTCLEIVDNITAMQACFDTEVHSAAHSNIGGLGLQFEGQVVNDNCSVLYSYSDDHKRCMTCPECEDGDSSLDCWCYVDPDIEECQQLNDSDYSVYNQKIPGDFRDLGSSPNEPMFLFHHVNMDRYFMIWQIMNYQYSDSYYHFPTSGGIYGTNLDDICSYEFPFVNIWDNDDGQYTNRDILDKTALLVNTYTYQTIIDMITPVDDSSSSSDSGEIIVAAVDNDSVNAAIVFDLSAHLGSISTTLCYTAVSLFIAAIIWGIIAIACERHFAKPISKVNRPTHIRKATFYSTF